MKTLLYLFILSMTLGIFSCVESGDKFTGRIIENGTNKPLSDVLVYIYAETSHATWLIDSVKTDATGRWTSIIDEGTLHFIGKVKKPGYFSKLGTKWDGKVWRSQDPYVWASGPMANRDNFIDAVGYIRVKIENDPNKPGVAIIGTFPGFGSVETLSKYEGIRPIEANRFRFFDYTIDDFIQQTSFSDSIYIIPADTTYLNISF